MAVAVTLLTLTRILTMRLGTLNDVNFNILNLCDNEKKLPLDKTLQAYIIYAVECLFDCFSFCLYCDRSIKTTIGTDSA